MPADGLGVVLLLRHLVAKHHLKGVLKDVGHIVKIKLLDAAGGEILPEVTGHILVSGHIDLEAALHPKDGLHQAVHIVPVGLRHLRGAVDKGVADSHLAAGPLHGDIHRLFGGGKEGLVKLQNRQKTRVQGGSVFHRDFNSGVFHVLLPPR